MPYTVSITSQGQISIPAAIRRELGLDKFRRGIVSVDDGKVVIEPVQDILSLKGTLKAAKTKLTPAQMRKAFEQYLADERMK